MSKPETKVRFYATLRDKLGEREVAVRGRDVGEVLDGLKRHFGPVFTDNLYPDGRLNERYIILLRGRRIFSYDLKKVKLGVGDAIDIFPPVAGG